MSVCFRERPAYAGRGKGVLYSEQQQTNDMWMVTVVVVEEGAGTYQTTPLTHCTNSPNLGFPRLANKYFARAEAFKHVDIGFASAICIEPRRGCREKQDDPLGAESTLR